VSDRELRDRQQTVPGALTIVLVHPRIPQNAGNIARLCAATGSRLDLVRPLFHITDRQLKRAGLDYWHLLDVRVYTDLDHWFAENSAAACWLVEVGGGVRYTDVQYAPGDCLFFGDEEKGLPADLLARFAQRWVHLPQQGVRSLNLSNAVAVVCYEALRQLDWRGAN
jgi:tRNA (cytidine/uridine-2'-O-)-methyltransferase